MIADFVLDPPSPIIGGPAFQITAVPVAFALTLDAGNLVGAQAAIGYSVPST